MCFCSNTTSTLVSRPSSTWSEPQSCSVIYGAFIYTGQHFNSPVFLQCFGAVSAAMFLCHLCRFIYAVNCCQLLHTAASVCAVVTVSYLAHHTSLFLEAIASLRVNTYSVYSLEPERYTDFGTHVVCYKGVKTSHINIPADVHTFLFSFAVIPQVWLSNSSDKNMY